MKLAFCLFRYFPFGGLQRDFMQIATACQTRGHEIHVLTTQWEGDIPSSFHLHLIAVSGWCNASRMRSYASGVLREVASQAFDRIIGFNRIPGLDIYFAGDLCYQHHIKTQRSFWYRLTFRYHCYVALERSVFSPESQTEILLLNPAEKEHIIRYYSTPEHRFHLLPPGIARNRLPPENKMDIRQEVRDELGIHHDQTLILMIASRFKTKGVDRAMRALASLLPTIRQSIRLVILGDDDPRRYQRLARRLGIEQQVSFLGGRHDVPRFLFAADLLLHPAYREAAGMVLLEAMVAGLPVLTTANCGYAPYIKIADAGIVIDHPFSQSVLEKTLQSMLKALPQAPWKNNARAYVDTHDLFSLSEKAAEWIEKMTDSRKYPQ